MSTIRFELARIVISEINNQQVIYLREVGGSREFPIVVGIFEATSIDRRVKQSSTPRPLTHDLIINLVELFGGQIQDVYIHTLEGETYFASLRISTSNEIKELDIRPSDAVAIAVSCQPHLPIMIEERVIERVVKQV
ncbi:MAG: bifunctional nuclease family protein [Planctomycetaceae bacterium]|jgi:bifunctional DNase/RNase|nr:bifunctional nuclease family protein [Planctomycetaceae bacterium]